jgi:TonB family protein
MSRQSGTIRWILIGSLVLMACLLRTDPTLGPKGRPDRLHSSASRAESPAPPTASEESMLPSTSEESISPSVRSAPSDKSVHSTLLPQTARVLGPNTKRSNSISPPRSKINRPRWGAGAPRIRPQNLPVPRPRRGTPQAGTLSSFAGRAPVPPQNTSSLPPVGSPLEGNSAPDRTSHWSAMSSWGDGGSGSNAGQDGGPFPSPGSPRADSITGDGSASPVAGSRGGPSDLAETRITPPRLFATDGLQYPGEGFHVQIRHQDLGPGFVILGTEGTVRLRVLVKLDGTVQEVAVTSSSGSPVLDRAAVAAVRRWLFIPATRDGDPIDAYATFAIRFIVR